MNDTKPWWQSKTMWGGLVAFAGAIVGLTAAQQSEIVDIITGVAAAAGTAYALYGRIRASKKVTL